MRLDCDPRRGSDSWAKRQPTRRVAHASYEEGVESHVLWCRHAARTSVGAFSQNSLNRAATSEHIRFPRTRSALDRGGMVRTWPTSLVRPDGLVEPQSKTKATRHGDPDPGTIGRGGVWHCRRPFGLALRVFLAPGQHPTPREGKEGGGVVAPLLPG